ncbi:hypothetical protein [Pedobacter sandarakinus]|uniref:hypothetical protein n=1 Tax=Pedobacter sandarakinus TaxID=353156 RepID=UPI002247B5B2|nr:hypothetical protein [Pedobacter sandarakinus]MCX2574646.1 hypothetical protein [Pedobacter sandarakinus]
MNFRHALLLIFLILTTDLFGQVKIDNNVTVTFPGKPETKEFTENIGSSKASIKAFYLNTKEQSFIALRTVLFENDNESVKPAASSTELQTIYDKDINFQINAMKNKGFTFSDSLKIKIQNLEVYRLKYILADTNEPAAESLLLFLNGIRYVFIYSKVNSFTQADKEKFLNSIAINNLQNASQVKINDNTMNWISYGFYAVLVIGFVIYFRLPNKNKSKYGINLKVVYCPNCKTKQPFIRIPKNITQTLFGGTICPKCSAQLDKYGNIV